MSKLLTHEADVCRAQLSQLQADLAEFEQRYGLSSDAFYRRFQAGQTERAGRKDLAASSSLPVC